MQIPPLSVRFLTLLATAFLGGGSPLMSATLYWDVNGGTGGLGGTGTWANGAGNWSTDVNGTLPTTWDNSVRNSADFRGTAGTVTTSGAVAAGSLVFNSGGYEITGTALTIGRLSGTSGLTAVNFASGSGDVTIANDVVINDLGTAAAGGGNGYAYSFANQTSSHLYLNGSITLNYAGSVDSPTGLKVISLVGNSTGSIHLNGAIQTSAGTSTQRLQFNGASGATYYVSADNSAGLTNGTGSQVVKGTVYLENAKALGNNSIQIGVSSTGASETAAVLSNGAYTIGNAVSLGGANADSLLVIGGGSAHVSEFSGNVNAGTSTQTLRLTAASGGRVNFSGSLSGTGSGQYVIQGAGVVALTRATGNTYSRGTSVSSGTLLLMNTSNSATGTSLISVANGAALGGTGTATGAVTSAAAGSIFTPGDRTATGISSIGTLNLTGGLTASSGATFQFDLNGASIDGIHFGAGALSLGGAVTFNFTSLGPVNTGVAYSLFSGTGTWSGAPAFAFNAPAGYVLDAAYGGGSGYVWDAAGHSLTVQFAAIPEPSTTVLLGLGCAVVLGLRRRQRA